MSVSFVYVYAEMDKVNSRQSRKDGQCVCVCVCVCDTEREIKRERGGGGGGGVRKVFK